MSYEGEKERELCPNLTTYDDLINKIGVLTIESLNKDKVLKELWAKLDNTNSSDDVLKKKIAKLTAAVSTIEKDKENLKRALNKKMTQHREEFNNTLNGKSTEISTLKAQLLTATKQLSDFKKSIKPKRVTKKKGNSVKTVKGASA